MVRYQPPQDWQHWVEWVAAGLHGRSRWRLSLIFLGMIFARGRRTVTTWLRAASITQGFANYYYFLQPLGRKSKVLAQRLWMLLLVRLVKESRVLLAVDDSPTQRYGPKVQGAGIHHNPTPGPADQQFLYGHIWVTISLVLRHPLWQSIGLPLLGLLYVRANDLAKIPARQNWEFRTKLQLAVQALRPFVELAVAAGKTVWVVADGAYAKRPFLQPLRARGVTVVSRLRKDAALRTVPKQPRTRKRGRPRQYGAQRIHLARRAAHPKGWFEIECSVYGVRVKKTIKTFLATYAPAGGLIRVVLVREDHGCQFFFCTDPQATPGELVEAFADRATIEQDFHDVKEVWGAGQQQVRNVWSNVACWNLNQWVFTLVELCSWDQPAEKLVNRSDRAWDNPSRRPSHADRRRAIAREMLDQELNSVLSHAPNLDKIRQLA